MTQKQEKLIEELRNHKAMIGQRIEVLEKRYRQLETNIFFVANNEKAAENMTIARLSCYDCRILTS